ncbi:hypothetical protein [Ruegeria sp. MALMAid1280]|uniref:hypothetical protein n=1 Tax=Ruegeria sp. MALMAid1280 TaxID=3411634 RepID=UPI003B9E7AE7
MTTLTLEVEDAPSLGRQNIILHGDNGDTVRVHTELSAPGSDPLTLDSPLCLVIFHAMQHCKRLKIDGVISEKLYRNIIAFQEAWHCHYPGWYQMVEIEPQGIARSDDTARETKNRGVIQTFSGGVDSIFTLQRPLSPINTASDGTSRSAVLVHGFDIPRSNQKDFDALRKRIEKITDAAGVELHVVKTSLRDSLPSNWEHSHGAALAGILHLYAHDNYAGAIASSDPYNYVSFVPHAWGSSPATDYLLSGDEIEIIHDGAGYSRPQKIAYLAEEWRQMLELAQFCWEGDDRSENCGECDKCIQTRLALRAAGQDELICFKTKFERRMIKQLKLSDGTMGDLLPLIDFADERNCSEPWVRDIKEQVSPFMPAMYKSDGSLARSLRYFRSAVRELIS